MDMDGMVTNGGGMTHDGMANMSHDMHGHETVMTDTDGSGSMGDMHNMHNMGGMSHMMMMVRIISVKIIASYLRLLLLHVCLIDYIIC